MKGVSDPPLKALHDEATLVRVKLETFSRMSTEFLIESLKPGQAGALKTRPDGIVIDGHHRLRVLRDRGVDVDRLPRETIPRE
jgi:hypothetical protein